MYQTVRSWYVYNLTQQDLLSICKHGSMVGVSLHRAKATQFTFLKHLPQQFPHRHKGKGAKPAKMHFYDNNAFYVLHLSCYVASHTNPYTQTCSVRFILSPHRFCGLTDHNAGSTLGPAYFSQYL